MASARTTLSELDGLSFDAHKRAVIPTRGRDGAQQNEKWYPEFHGFTARALRFHRRAPGLRPMYPKGPHRSTGMGARLSLPPSRSMRKPDTLRATLRRPAAARAKNSPWLPLPPAWLSPKRRRPKFGALPLSPETRPPNQLRSATQDPAPTFAVAWMFQTCCIHPGQQVAHRQSPKGITSLNLPDPGVCPSQKSAHQRKSRRITAVKISEAPALCPPLPSSCPPSIRAPLDLSPRA